MYSIIHAGVMDGRGPQRSAENVRKYFIVHAIVYRGAFYAKHRGRYTFAARNIIDKGKKEREREGGDAKSDI